MGTHPGCCFTGEISTAYPWNVPEYLHGPAVVFDVNTASRNIADLVLRCRRLFVADNGNIHRVLEKIPDAVLIGESDDPDLRKRFVSGNDPGDLSAAAVRGKNVIFITYNGTQTIHELWRKGARPVLIASYPNLHTVTDWLIRFHGVSERIYLVPCGGREAIYAGDRDLLEDRLCAGAAEKLLRGQTPDFRQIFGLSKAYIRKTSPPVPSKEADFKLLFTETDTLPAVPFCEERDGLLLVSNALMR